MQQYVDRADAVKQYLVNSGIDGQRLQIKGYGAKKPIRADNVTEGLRLN